MVTTKDTLDAHAHLQQHMCLCIYLISNYSGLLCAHFTTLDYTFSVLFPIRWDNYEGVS